MVRRFRRRGGGEHATLDQRWRELLAILQRDDRDLEALQRAGQAFNAAVRPATPGERSSVLQSATAALALAPVDEAGVLALCAGVLVESGAPGEPLHRVLVGRLPDVIADAGRFVAAVEAAFPAPSEDDGQPDEDEDGIWVGERHVPLKWVEQQQDRDEEAVVAWGALDLLCTAELAAASRDRSLRAALAAMPWPGFDAVARSHPIVGCLRSLALTPCEETFVLVHGPTGRVFELVVDGVGVNFELHTLLAAAVAPLVGDRAPGRAVLDCLSGRGPQQSETPSSGTWNLYDWRAVSLAPDRLSSVPTMLWIWNEGRPGDVPSFEGRRVVVAGPPTYERTWNTARSFDALAPRVSLTRELEPAEAGAFLERARQSAAGAAGDTPAKFVSRER